MASMIKLSESASIQQIRHVERNILNPSNKDIDNTKTYLNYSLTPEREISAIDYYKKRSEEVYIFKRKDVVRLVGWVVTVPKDLPIYKHEDYFKSVNNFLLDRYGEKNCIASIVHLDEVTPHLHFLMTPCVPDKKRGGEKLGAKTLFDCKELRNFHPDLEKYLKSDGINANIRSGITKAQGGNRTVLEMKAERRHQYEHDRTIERGRW